MRIGWGPRTFTNMEWVRGGKTRPFTLNLQASHWLWQFVITIDWDRWRRLQTEGDKPQS